MQSLTFVNKEKMTLWNETFILSGSSFLFYIILFCVHTKIMEGEA